MKKSRFLSLALAGLMLVGCQPKKAEEKKEEKKEDKKEDSRLKQGEEKKEDTRLKQGEEKKEPESKPKA